MRAFIDASAAWTMARIRGLASRLGSSLPVATLLVAALLVTSSAVCVGLASALSRGMPRALLSLIALVSVLWTAVTFNRLLGLGQAYGKAFAARDLDEVTRLRAIIEGSGEPRTPLERALRAVGDAELLLAFERFAEARDRFARIDLDALPPLARPGIVSELGYATAHAGQAEEGVRWIEKAIAEADAQSGYPDGKRWFLDYRHGAALSLAGRHDEAVAVLDRVLADSTRGEVEPWTEALFFTAQSERRLGRDDVAAEILEVAATEGEGRFRTRARMALEEARRSPHRGGGAVRVVVDDDHALAEPEAVLEPARRVRDGD